jgi:hypothetical protein
MIKFRYKLPEGLVPLVNKEVVDFNDEYITGIMPEEISGNLKHCSMYMICELEEHDKITVLRNPIAVVETNQPNAMIAYRETYGKDNGTVLCEIVDRCDNIKVIPL